MAWKLRPLAFPGSTFWLTEQNLEPGKRNHRIRMYCSYCTLAKRWNTVGLVVALALLHTSARANHDELELFQPVTTPSGRPLPSHALEHMARPVRVAAKLLERDQFRLN